MKTGLAVVSERTPTEKLAINTIRTLCMDAVQAANSGHPGSPMGMAPTAYVLWQRFLRFDPEHPIWGNRDRFVLSAGHCLDAAVRAAAPDRRQGRQPEVRGARRAVGQARRHQDVPPARQQVPRPPRVPLDQRRRDHHRAARPGPGHQRRHGARLAAGRPPRSTGPASRCSTSTSTPCAATAASWKASPPRRPPSPATGSCPTSAGSTTATRSPSRGTPTWPSARTSPRSSSAWAGTSPASATPTTWRCSTGLSRSSRTRTTGRR